MEFVINVKSLKIVKVSKTTKIRKRYNQIPHLTQYTTWESNKNTINITNKSQEVSPFPAGDHKATTNRRESMKNTRLKNTNDQQKKFSVGTFSKNILLDGLNRFHGASLTLSSKIKTPREMTKSFCHLHI